MQWRHERLYKVFLVYLPFLLVIAGGVMGIWALMDVPVLGVRLSFSPRGVEVTAVDEHGPAAGQITPGECLRAIGTVVLEKDDLLRYPEFVRHADEQRWRDRQAAIYQQLHAGQSVSVRVATPEGEERTVRVRGERWTLSAVLRRGFPIYLSGLILAYMSVLIYSYSRDIQHRTSQVFFVSLGLYHMMTASMALREITLNPLLECVITRTAYVAAGACIALIHFALIFPRRKAFLEKHPRLIWIPYLYFGGSVVLYLAGLIAFGSTYLCLNFWALVAVVATFHGYFSERDILLKQQILLFLMVPVLMAVFFCMYIIMPGVMRTNMFEYSNFAILSIAAAFSMALAVENRRIYLESLEKEHANLRDRLQLVREMHDNFGNVLTGIVRLTERAEKDRLAVTEPSPVLPQIRKAAQNCITDVRDFIAAVDPGATCWGEFAAECRVLAAEYLAPLDLRLEFHAAIENGETAVRPPVRYHLTGILREALGNIVKHAGAKQVAIRLRVQPAGAELCIEDDGVGFDRQAVGAGSYGLVNLDERARELGGRLKITSPGKGTRVTVNFIP